MSSIARDWRLACALVVCAGSSRMAFAQNAQLSGIITDPQKAVVSQATVEVTNEATQVKTLLRSNSAGVYSAPSLQPGQYRVTISASGFETQTLTHVTVNVAAKLALDITLRPGSANESVTVNGSEVPINTTDASVSTVVDRQFVENIPLNGRSFQSLMTSVPGVSSVPSQGVGSSGEITVNGQRTESNQFTVDGVSANTGAQGYPAGAGAGYSGSIPGESILGTTQTLVSIDALQEFRASTSTYSAEYGRTPGGQFVFNTRSGTNAWHGSAFEYFRNDVLDANNYFNKRTTPITPRQVERQNDFGGTFSGPLSIPHVYDGRDRTFFFFSYEGLRLRSPVAAFTMEVPNLSLRQLAPAELRPFLNAFPLPNGAESGDGLGLAYYTAGYSSPSALDTYSLRVDHHFSDRFSVFARYSDSPTSNTTRSSDPFSPNLAEIDPQTVRVRTITGGATNMFTSRLSSEFRVNGTWNDYADKPALDNFGGATPMTLASSGAAGLTDKSWIFFYLTGHGAYPAFRLYPHSTSQTQFNIVEKLSYTVGRHQFKAGVDYRRLTTYSPIADLYESSGFNDAAQVIANNGSPGITRADHPAQPVYSNLSLFLQDEWKVSSRLNASLGVRWDMNPPPRDAGGNQPYTLDQITNLATAQVAPQGADLWKTTHANFSPRVGLAYQLHQAAGHETVLRAGFGQFYDTGTALASAGYQYGVGITRTVGFSDAPFPLSQQTVSSIPAPSTSSPYSGQVFAYDPHLKQPYTLQWNVAVEQALGSQQTLTLSYVASAGKHLLSQLQYDPSSVGNPNFTPRWNLFITANHGGSNYQALQLQFQRKLSRGLQVLTSYTWAHAIDNSTTNFTLSELLRASSDFDIRNNFQLALTYDLPSRSGHGFAPYLLSHWSTDLRTTVRSALPVDVFSDYSSTNLTGTFVSYHPNRVAGQSLYTYDSSLPGGRGINYNAYTPAYASDGVTLVEGNAGRNSARGFDAVQQDIALRRDFPFTERVGLQFRIEAFNLLNHSIMGTVNNYLSMGATGPNAFGVAINTLNGQLGGLNSLYQTGGPRSLQAALKLHF